MHVATDLPLAALFRDGCGRVILKERVSMRLLLGMILGAALTIGTAYVIDTSKPSGSSTDARPMVNWDVVGRNVDSLTTTVKQGWAKLTS
jgi:hypothetical protein